MTKLSPGSALELVAASLAVALGLLPVAASPAEVGETLQNVELRDGADQAARIPDLGVKVVAIFYNDADEADLNDPLADALKARKFDETRYRGVGVANLADSKAPNFLIRKIVRGKIEKYKSTILTDPDRLLAKAWRLGDCNNTSVFLLLDRTGKVVHAQRGAIRGDDIARIVELVAKQIATAP
jgi:predicted transcriptional regulator